MLQTASGPVRAGVRSFKTLSASRTSERDQVSGVEELGEVQDVGVLIQSVLSELGRMWGTWHVVSVTCQQDQGQMAMLFELLPLLCRWRWGVQAPNVLRPKAS